jgi:hypothetical protein
MNFSPPLIPEFSQPSEINGDLYIYSKNAIYIAAIFMPVDDLPFSLTEFSLFTGTFSSPWLFPIVLWRR